MFSLPSLPAGLPSSLWFFIAAIVVYLLQRFPLTGIFLMVLLAALWSAVLINLGMAGIVVEVIAGKVRPLWLLLPLLYLGGYYAAYAIERQQLAGLIAEFAEHNEKQRMAFDPGRQDLVVEEGADAGLSAAQLIAGYALPRIFSGERMRMVVDPEVHDVVTRESQVMTSAGIMVERIGGWRERKATAASLLVLPGKPDRPTVAIAATIRKERRGSIPLFLVDTRVIDTAARKSLLLRSGRASLLKSFPMWTMGCFLNSGAAKWQCVHGFMRDAVAIEAGARPYQGPTALVAAALGLKAEPAPRDRAAGLADVGPLIEAASEGVVAKEMGIVTAIFAAPLKAVKDAWLWHLPSRPDRTAPLVPQMVAALAAMPEENRLGSENARQLWRLLAKQEEPVLAPYRTTLTGWIGGSGAGRHYDAVREYLPRLDASVPAERSILLGRLEAPGGDLPSDLLPSFCRMGPSAPPEVGERLLALWHRRGQPKGNQRPVRRDSGDAMLYFTLARMGLKQEAGRVEQHYWGTTFTAIWERVGPETPVEDCPSSSNDLSNWARGVKRG